MPFVEHHANDVGLETPDGPVCKFDSENGQIKKPEEIFKGGVEFFGQSTDGDHDLAARVTRKNMKSLPYWQAHPFAELEGEETTDQEFGDVMAKL
jgi:hypothetical protein